MSVTSIHPSAIIDPACEIGPGVEIGPGCVLRGEVRLAEGVRLMGMVYMQGPVRVGPRTTIYPGVCLGFPPQDVKFTLGMATAGVSIGADTILREHVTIHAASKPPEAGPPTSVGDRCFFMAGSHAGHDVQVGNDVVLVNNVLLAGHVHLADRVTVGGASAIHQFCRIGRFAFVSGLTAISRDVPPFVIAAERNLMWGINAVGLRRAGFPRPHITLLREAYREAFRVPRPRAEQIEVLRTIGADCPPAMEMAEFVAASKRGIVASSKVGEDEDDAG
ncbi:MAG: acyl-ACP--UDP-N-acetylglucosamine O-acyltransferase [Planctomycetota bacterium]|nr:acyl-ACP--UDP-N-acetylglucosamine O-acyltransferase [Planctomycetota bacterium]